ncbi:hypothetical protein ACHQM5_019956 [Ranunculus cassubicifolius]
MITYWLSEVKLLLRFSAHFDGLVEAPLSERFELCHGGKNNSVNVAPKELQCDVDLQTRTRVQALYHLLGWKLMIVVSWLSTRLAILIWKNISTASQARKRLWLM